MLGRDDRQLGFSSVSAMESWERKAVVPENTIYSAFTRAGDIFRDESFAGAYSPVGRPSIHPSRLIKVLLLQFLEGVSDREAENRARYDLRWKKALNVGL